MNLKVYENRLVEFSDKEQGTQNENIVQTLNIEIPSIYDDFYKKIVFVTEDGIYWDYIENDGSYTIKSNITKFTTVDFYIWLTKTENEVTQDFRTKTYPLFFNENVSPDGEVPQEQETEMERVIRILEEEIDKVEDLEDDIHQLEEDVRAEVAELKEEVENDVAEMKQDVEDVIQEAETAIGEANNLNLDASKIDKTATVTLTKKDGTVKTVQISDGVSLQFMWDGTRLGIKTDNMQDYVFVDLQGQQGPIRSTR